MLGKRLPIFALTTVTLFQLAMCWSRSTPKNSRRACERRAPFSSNGSRLGERARTLGDRQFTAAATIEEREALMEEAAANVAVAEARLADRTIRAAFDGVVGVREVGVGDLVEPGDTITELTDISVLKLDFTIPAVYLGATSCCRAGDRSPYSRLWRPALCRDGPGAIHQYRSCDPDGDRAGDCAEWRRLTASRPVDDGEPQAQSTGCLDGA